MDSRTETVLQQLVRREGRSLLQYLSEAFPWTDSAGTAELAQFHQLAQEERDSTAKLMHFLTRKRVGVPNMGAYPSTFTNINFIALDHLIPLLVDAQRKALPDLEHDLANMSDAEARSAVQAVLDTKQRHLRTLEMLAAAHPQPASH